MGKKTAGVQKGNFHELKQSVKKIEQCIAAQHASNSSTQSNRNDPLALPAISPDSTTASLYALGTLPSSKIVKANSLGAVGRRAALIETEETNVSNLDVILNSEDRHWKKNVATILPKRAQQALTEKYNTVSLTPNRVLSAVEEKFDYVVIDERCSRHGQWAGFLETFKFGTFLELAEGLREARRRGAIVFVLEDQASGSLTSSIRELADIRLNTSIRNKDERYETLRIYRDIRELPAQEGRANV